MEDYSDPIETAASEDNAMELGDDISHNYSYSKSGDIVSLKFKPNTLRSFPLNKFLNYTDITYLSLPNNNLKKINEDIFSQFPFMTWFDVRNNKIQEFPKVTNHKHLEQILLGGNKIEKLPIELGSFEKLYGLQVTGNPLVFPDLNVFETNDYNLVEFLKLCWKHQTTNPLIKVKTENKQKRKPCTVKKEDCVAPVQHYRNVANVVAEKVKSNDPIDQIMANNVLKKLREIESDLKKTKDREALKEWREKYMSTGVARNKDTKDAPYGIDPDFMSMMTRREFLSSDSNKQKKIIRVDKKPINFNEELKKVDKELDYIKSRKPSLDPAAEKLQRMVDIQKMNNLQKKIKELQLANMKT